jgi:hypothetical protein
MIILIKCTLNLALFKCEEAIGPGQPWASTPRTLDNVFGTFFFLRKNKIINKTASNNNVPLKKFIKRTYDFHFGFFGA